MEREEGLNSHIPLFPSGLEHVKILYNNKINNYKIINDYVVDYDERLEQNEVHKLITIEGGETKFRDLNNAYLLYDQS